jgi:hypothetical protein
VPARRFQRRSVRSPRRRTTWAVNGPSTTTCTAGGFAWFDLLAAYNAMPNSVSAGITVVRIHMRLAVVSGLVTPGQAVVTAIMRGQNDDTGANNAGSPSPRTDFYQDYMMWESQILDASNFTQPGGSNNWSWDVRAKRRLPNLNQTILFGVSSLQAVQINHSSRLLLALP